MILDYALHKRPAFARKDIFEHVQRVGRMSKRFVFGKEASRLIGQFVASSADLIIKNRQFALPLYDHMYMEYDAEALFMGHEVVRPDQTADRRLGYLFDRRMAYVVPSQDTVGTTAMLSPITYYMNARGDTSLPKLAHINVEFTGEGGPDAKLRMLIGKYRKEYAKLDPVDAVAVIFENHVFTTATREATEALKTDGMRDIIHTGTYDMLFIWAGLLWLNSVPKTVAFAPMPAGSRIWKGKRVALSAHHTIAINLTGEKSMRHAFVKAHKQRMKPRHHDVRAFWRHRGGVKGCSHVWPATPNDKAHYVCTRCGRIRFRVKEHQRGDMQRGFVTKDYSIKPT